jgi:hypothetical protein
MATVRRTPAPPVADPEPVISNIVVDERTNASFRVQWDVSEVAQGWIAYGTSNGGPYPNETNHETSFDYEHHIQTVPSSGTLTSGTAYYFVIHAIDQDGNHVVSPQQSTSTLPLTDIEFDSGMTYIANHVWPTGMGWTAGSLSTIRQNIQNLITSGGNGTDATHHVRHLPTPAALYPIDTYLLLLGRAHITFEFGGVENTSAPWGHTGGATISTIVASGPSSRCQVFTGGTSTGITYDDIRWHGGTLKGSAVNLASATAGSQAEEDQHGIGAFGATNCLVDHMIFTDFMGDNIYLCESRGTDGIMSGPWCDGWEMRYTQFLRCGRQGIAPGQGARNLKIHHNYFADPAYSYIDFESNRAYQGAENVEVDDNVFAGHWAWMQTGGPEGQGLAVPAVFFTSIETVTWSGYWRFRRNLLSGIHSSPFYNATVRQFIANAPWDPGLFTGDVLIEDNMRTSAKQAGPIVTMGRVMGSLTVRNNTEFKTASGVWLSASGGVVPVQSGNT